MERSERCSVTAQEYKQNSCEGGLGCVETNQANGKIIKTTGAILLDRSGACLDIAKESRNERPLKWNSVYTVDKLVVGAV